jgi:hypothetical protein
MPCENNAQEGNMDTIPGAVGAYFVSRDGGDFREYRKTAAVKALQMDRPFRVETNEGVMEGAAGDYLCEGPAGECWPIKRDIFKATYEPVE